MNRTDVCVCSSAAIGSLRSAGQGSKLGASTWWKWERVAERWLAVGGKMLGRSTRAIGGGGRGGAGHHGDGGHAHLVAGLVLRDLIGAVAQPVEYLALGRGQVLVRVRGRARVSYARVRTTT